MTELTADAMKVEQWPIRNLKPFAKNPRKITNAAIAKVADSIKNFGFRQAIVVDANGVIVVGHTRWAASKKLGLKTVPVHVAADLSPEDAMAYRLADNRTGEESKWDDDFLSDVMTELYEADFALEKTGFNPDEIADIFGIDLEPESETAAAADDAGPYKLTLEFKTQDEQKAMLAELQERGVQCKVSGRDRP